MKEAKEELIEVVDFLKNPKKFLDIGARNARCAFGAQGQVAASGVLEGVHFLFHDIGCRAGGFDEQFLHFHGGDAYFPVTVKRENFPRGCFQRGEKSGLRREDVPKSADGLDFHILGEMDLSFARSLTVMRPSR